MKDVECTFSGKSILGLTIPKHFNCWDLKKFLVIGSLKNLTRSYRTYPLKMDDDDMGFSFEEVEQAFEAGKNSWKKFMNEKLPSIIEYNKLDVLSLCSLTQKFM